MGSCPKLFNGLIIFYAILPLVKNSSLHISVLGVSSKELQRLKRLLLILLYRNNLKFKIKTPPLFSMRIIKGWPWG